MRALALWTVAALLSTDTLFAQEGAGTGPDEPSVIASLREDVDGILEKLNLDFYGHFKLDMSRDSAETNFGDTAFFVKNYHDLTGGDEDEESNVTARHSRLGVNWNGPESDGVKAFGKIEIDFLGKSLQKNTETQELQPALRMRHAYMKFDFPGDWSLVAGQTWDVFGPVQMKKLNTMVGWGQGNIAFRRPQLRVSKKVATGDKSDLTLALAVARAVARDSAKLDGDSQDDGEDSGVPDLQAHVGLKTPGPGPKPMKIGLGGFVGKREVGGGGDLTGDDHYDSTCLALDFQVPLTEELDVLGEAWTGTALDGYRGGVWQSYVVDNGRVEEIDASGAFVNVIWKPQPKWRFVAGHGFDDPRNGDFHGPSSTHRLKNTTTFANVMYSFYPGATVGIEYDRMETEYVDGDADSDRIQVSFMLKF